MLSRPSEYSRRRGRPPKFGRPARLVAVTLPNDVVSWLGTLDADVGRAMVRLHDRIARRGQREPGSAAPQAELVDVGESRGLIVIDPALGRAFLALESRWTMADLELSAIDAQERGSADARRSRALAEFRDQLRAWRTDHSMTLETRAIIVAGRRPATKRNRQSPR